MLQPVQNLSKFSFRIKRFSALSVDRRLLLSVRMSPAALKTRLLGTVLVGRPIKCQCQPLAGRVIEVEVIDRFLFVYFCEASSVNTACGDSVSCIKGIKRGHNRWAAGSGQAGNLIGGCSWRLCTVPAAGYINRKASSADFRGWYQLLIAQWHRTYCKTGYCNSWKSDPPCHIQSGQRRISPVSGKPAGSGCWSRITVHPY